MANTLNTAERKILQSAVSAYHAVLAPVQALSLNVDNDGKTKGETALVKVATARSAAVFGGSYITGDTTFTDKTVTLDLHSFASFHLTDVEASKHTFDIVEKAGIEAAHAVATNVFDYITSIWTDANYGSTGGSDYLASVAVSAFDADDVVDLGNLMDVDNVPQTDRSLVLTPGAHANLKKDNALQSADASGSTETLREGVTGRVDRFDVYMSSGISSTADTTNVYAFAVHPTAAAVALRTVPPSEEDLASAAGLRYGEMEVPGSGIRLGMRAWYDPNTGTRWGAFEALVGRAAVQANGLKRAKIIA